MNVIKITISGKSFLLPEPNEYDDYEFPTFIYQNLPLLKEYIEKGSKALAEFSKNPLAFKSNPFSDLPDVQYFKDRTGIIGQPFTMNDTELYILDRKVDIVLEMNFDE
ncbi:hypothetical protein KTJ20_09960 [Acinetobacter ursingii]|uniref:hypothetical protein n=1 Tax=Acinetobacter ursingii TaxID=108980 RepID=UPI0021CD970B|nr:hypothetical protein [Acinetobacter ursingii]MCU4589074.1 hypothetical protein [Acinetobacter ursingii]